MTKTVLKFGLISGALISVFMGVSMTLASKGSISHSYVVGYTSMILAFLLVGFGIRSYRDSHGGTITFGKAFQVGVLIMLLASAMYVATWEVIYFGRFLPNFMDQYTASTLKAMRASGASDAAIASKAAEMKHFAEMYENPIINIGMTFLEIVPVGLIMTLISAAILRRKEPQVSFRAA